MIVNQCYETIIVLYLSTILTEKCLDKNIKIKPELTGNRVLECSKLKQKLNGRGHPYRTHPHPPPCQFPTYAPEFVIYFSITRFLFVKMGGLPDEIGDTPMML